MKRFAGFIIMIVLMQSIYSLELNVHNILSMQIPDEFEIISITQSLDKHLNSDQYTLRVNVEYVFANQHLFLTIRFFGRGDDEKVLGLSKNILVNNVGKYYPNYQTSSQIEYLKKNYDEDSEINTNGLKFSRFISEWSSGWTTDYYGFYFKLDNYYFNEVIISTINYWDAFGGSKLINNDKGFRHKINSLNKDGQKMFEYIDDIMESVMKMNKNNGIHYNNNLLVNNNKSLPGYWIPTTDNLRIRENYGIESKILGYVRDKPYRVIEVGPDFQIDGIVGKWYRIASVIGTECGWAFSGYMRGLKEDELQMYFEGI